MQAIVMPERPTLESICSCTACSLCRSEEDGLAPDTEVSGTELKSLFGENVAQRNQELWRRINAEEYETKQEMDFLLFELLHQEELVHRKLLQKFRKAQARKYLNCSWRGRKPLPEAERIEVEVALPYGETKRMSESFRALFWQFALELSSLITDILLLFVLYKADRTLFYVSLTAITLATFLRLLSSFYVADLVNWKEHKGLYLVGVLVNCVETNLGIRLIRLALRENDPHGRKYYDSNTAEVVKQSFKDDVSGLARLNVKSGRAELVNIAAVTLIQDLPQIAVQSIFYVQQAGVEETNIVFVLASVTTGLHILFQWAEARITWLWIRKALLSLEAAREAVFDSDGSIEIKREALFKCLESSATYDITEFVQVHKERVYSVDFSEMGTAFQNDNLTPVGVNCPTLVQISLTGTSVTNQGVMNLARSCRQLAEISLSYTDVSDAGIKVLAERCRFLSRINLSWTAVTDRSLIHLSKNCSSLKKLLLESCKGGVTDKGIERLAAGCRELVHLDLDNTPVSNLGLEALGKHCSRLEHVYLAETLVQDAGVTALAKGCPRLKTLHLSQTIVTNKSLIALGLNCPRLSEVYLPNVPSQNGTGITDVGIEAISSGCHQIRALDLTNLNNISNDALGALSKGCKQLEIIRLVGTNVTDQGVWMLVLGCSSLQRIDLDGLKSQIRNLSLEALAINCRLHSLHLTDTKVSDDGIIAMVQRQRSLKKLSIDFTEVTDQGVRSIGKKCRQLTHLTLGGQQITNAAIEAIAEGCRNLRVISLEQTGINDEGLRTLARRCSKISEIYLAETAVGNNGVAELCNRQRTLTRLGVESTRISDDFVEALTENLSQMRRVWVSSTDMTGEGILKLANRCPSLKRLVAKEIHLDAQAISGLNENRVDVVT